MSTNLRPCAHVHLSGRACGGLAHAGYRYCVSHASQGGNRALCDACRSMLTSFTPRGGWNPEQRRQLRAGRTP